MFPRAPPGAGAPSPARAPFTEGRPEIGKGQRQGDHRAHRRRQHLFGPGTAIRPATSPPTPPTAIPARATTAPARRACSWAPAAAIGQYDYSASNYTNALNEQMAKLCDNAKAGNVLMMTVSLDLSTDNADENKAIEALKKCASDSRFRKDPADPSKPAKLYWNATGSQPRRKIQGNRRRTVEPAHRRLILSAQPRTDLTGWRNRSAVPASAGSHAGVERNSPSRAFRPPRDHAMPEISDALRLWARRARHGADARPEHDLPDFALALARARWPA